MTKRRTGRTRKAAAKNAAVAPARLKRRKAARNVAPAHAEPTFPIVGIGASAGGLEALQRFFEQMPADSGLAFVVVPHLDARTKSMLVELLQRETSMKVVPIADGLVPRANQVHVIPPDATLTVEQGKLRLHRPREHPMTIDPFLRSLAEDQQDRAIGIILSGAGSDGTLGVKAVKEHGGFTLAQSGRGVRHHSMPQNAIATGLIDIIASVEDMPAQLVAYAGHWRRLRAEKGESGLAGDIATHLDKIHALLRGKTGHDFSRYKNSTFMRRVQRRMHVVQAESASDYVERLRNTAGEADLLFKDLLIGVTQFFRDPHAFEALASQALAPAIAGKRPDEPLRIWVPGCATGEEAYSIAILVREQMAGAGVALKVQIFATDLDAEALEFARQGCYPEAITRDVSPERLHRFFVRENGFYRVAKDIREMCVFSVHNLTKDAPFSRLDLVSCRNLMIYMDSSLQNHVVRLFHFALRDGGYLFLGSSETISQHAKLFARIEGNLRLFKAKPAARPAFDLPLGIAPHRRSRPVRDAASPGAEDTVGRRAMRVMEGYAPAYVVVDEHYETLHFSGRTGRYLQPTTGTANLHLFNILDPGLRPDMRAALHRAASGNRRTTQQSQSLDSGGEAQKLTIVVEPLALADGTRHFVVIFQDAAGSRGEAATEPAAPGAGHDEVVTRLEAELVAARERHQATIEELETANEEMKASNEEFQSVNEELQSSNEELETSKEELQSLNEELETVNAELNIKVESLERANNDRKNLLESTQIATIFLDQALRIKSFTPAIEDVFNLIEADIGRPITDIATRLAYRDLEADVRKVMRTLERSQQEVTSGDGKAVYEMRILPYRTIDNVINGVVVTFVDITERKRSEEALARLASIAEKSHDAIIGLTEDGVITAWNRGAEQTYGYTAEETVGQPLSLLIPADRPTEFEAIVQRIKKSRASSLIETLRLTKDGRQLVVASTVSPIRNPADKLIAASAIERDITEQKQAEERQRTLIAELNHRVKNTLAAVLSISANTLYNTASLETFGVDFEGRIHALAKAHDLLSASGWTGADMASLTAAELAPYGDIGERVRIAGERVALSPSAALSFAMILHELATNAAKYGALSREAGRLEVRWSNSDAGQRLVLHWTESGGPPTEAPRRKGFGLGLIERSVRSDLQGTASLDFARTGLRCRIEVPLKEVKSRADG